MSNVNPRIPPTKRKPGRPLGSQNKKPRRSTRRARQLDCAAADEAFAAAFGSVPINPPQPDPATNESSLTPEQDEVDFGLMLADGDREENNNSDDDADLAESNIGFGNEDMFDVNDLMDFRDSVDVGDYDAEGATEEFFSKFKHGCVAKNSLKSYITGLCTFLYYIYENDRHLMHKSWIQSLKTMTFGISNEKKRKTIMRRTIRGLLTKPNDKCPPIELEKYPAKHFIKYLLSIKRDGERLSTASYNNKRSALFHLFRMYSVTQSENFNLELVTLFKSLKRMLAEEKQQGTGRIETGKTPISFGLYRRLNIFMLQDNSMEAIFGRAFMSLTWNLMCRASNTVSIHLHHLGWSDDCLLVYFAHMKNDQTGERKRDPRHIYGNPHDPVVCPLVAISTYLSTCNVTGTKDTCIFPGPSQYKRFSKYLAKILMEHEREIENEFGVEIKHLGVHSFRKGAATYVSSGSTCAPPQVATNLRAGWTMGGIQDTYLKYEGAGDQYVGRVVAGLPVCSAKFAVLPPQFVDCQVSVIDEMVKSCFSGMPSTLNSVCRFLTASLIFHFNELKTNVSPKNPLLLAPFVASSHFYTLRKFVTVLYPWEEKNIDVQVITGNEESEPIVGTGSLEPTIEEAVPPNQCATIRKATGIPAHVMLMADMQRVINSQQSVLIQLKNVISEELDKREVGHTTFQVQKQVHNMITNFESRIIKKFDEFSNTKNQDSTGKQDGIYQQGDPGGSRLFHWGDKFRRVPQNFTFPTKMTLKSAWIRYFLPNKETNVGPLRYLTGADLTKVKNGRKTLCDYRTVMQFMVDEAKKRNIYIHYPTEKQVNSIYSLVCGSVISLNKSKRCESFSWQSHVRYVRQQKKKNRIQS